MHPLLRHRTSYSREVVIGGVGDCIIPSIDPNNLLQRLDQHALLQFIIILRKPGIQFSLSAILMDAHLIENLPWKASSHSSITYEENRRQPSCFVLRLKTNYPTNKQTNKQTTEMYHGSTVTIFDFPTDGLHQSKRGLWRGFIRVVFL